MLKAVMAQSKTSPRGGQRRQERHAPLPKTRRAERRFDFRLETGSGFGGWPMTLRHAEKWVRLPNLFSPSRRLGAEIRGVRIVVSLPAGEPSLDRSQNGRTQKAEIRLKTFALQRLDFPWGHAGMTDHRGEPIAFPVVALGILRQVAVKPSLSHDTLEKGRPGGRTVDQELGVGRLQRQELRQFFADDIDRLIVEAQDHRGENRDAVRAQVWNQLLHRPPLLLGKTGPLSLVADPNTVNAGLEQLARGHPAERLHGGEGEDRKRSPSLEDQLPQSGGAVPGNKKILVDDRQVHPR